MRRERERGGGRREEKRVRCRTPVQPVRCGGGGQSEIFPQIE